MDVQVLVHLEPTAERESVWWADSPDIPGFSALAPSLGELRYRATQAIHEIVAEDGGDTLQLDIEFHLAVEAPQSAAEGIELRTDEKLSDATTRQGSGRPILQPA